MIEQWNNVVHLRGSSMWFTNNGEIWEIYENCTPSYMVATMEMARNPIFFIQPNQLVH